MATIISLAADKRRLTKNGTYKIRLYLNFKGERSYIQIPGAITVKDAHWSSSTGRITKGANTPPSPSYWNDFLQDKLSVANAVIESFIEDGTLNNYTHEELKKELCKEKKAQVSFSDYLDNLIDEFLHSGNDGQKRIYTQAKQFIKKYGDLGENGYQFKEVNYRLIRLMEQRYVPRIEGNLNGLAISLRTIRAVWNRAIKEGVTSSDAYPFNKYSIKKSTTHKTAITPVDFEKIGKLDLDKGTLAWHGRNMFFFSLFCRGMNFADIALLKYSNIQYGRIIYTRKKVGKRMDIKIDAAIQKVLDQYISPSASKSDYIFPVVWLSNPASASDQARAYLSSVNHALKRWSSQLEIGKPISFNTARHSWATIGRNMQVPLSVISQGMGHTDAQTTQIYLDEFEHDVMDDAASQVNQGISLELFG